MARWALLTVLLTCGCLRLQGAPLDGMEAASCRDAQVSAAAGQALAEINRARQDGYVLDLHRLTAAHVTKQSDDGDVFYLRLQVTETNCSVLDRERQGGCVARQAPAVIGLCKAAIFISRVHRVVRLYKYECALRPAVPKMCAGCPGIVDSDNAQVQSIAALSLDKFHKDTKPSKLFALLKVNRATVQVVAGRIHKVEYTIQETTCGADEATPTADKCPMMDCEFTHRGFCRATQFQGLGGETELSVDCQVYESEAADREKALHAAETDHAHNDTHAHDPKHDHAHSVDDSHTHDHVHDHTKSHAQHDTGAAHDAEHHHTHDHHAGSAHRHAHDHSHDHGHGHDHVHAHHAKAHDHSADAPNQHHKYGHADAAHTHEHDHELALDHEHKHAHLHEHEHHHHHHQHTHETAGHHEPQGAVVMLPWGDRPATLPAFPDQPAAGPEVGVTLPLVPDPDIPGRMAPIIRPFPTSAASADCPAAEPDNRLSKLFAEDPEFKV